MLSDFDLAKQSGEPGGKPAMIHQEENGVRHPSWLDVSLDNDFLFILDTINRYAVMYG